MSELKIALLGCGTVGSGLVQILKSYPEIEITAILVKDISKKRDLDLPTEIFTESFEDILAIEGLDIVVELMGSVDYTKILLDQVLDRGINIVTANKDLIATKGELLFAKAKENGRTIMYEAAVAGGIPVISTLKQSLRGNHINKVLGIINGTTNYILDQMKSEGTSFDIALKQAQELGFAEADPTSDVDGFDAAYKIAILASIISEKKVNFKKVFKEGIRGITQKDIQSANKRGYVIKLLGIADNTGDELDVRVHPVMIPEAHSLASIHNENNAVLINGSALGDLTLIGKGAGSLPTASAVMGDILMLRSQSQGVSKDLQVQAHAQEAKLKNINVVSNAYYVRVAMQDMVGVLKDVGEITSRHGANVKFIDQYDVANGAALADFVIDPISEQKKDFIIRDLESMQSIKAVESVIRILI